MLFFQSSNVMTCCQHHILLPDQFVFHTVVRDKGDHPTNVQQPSLLSPQRESLSLEIEFDASAVNDVTEDEFPSNALFENNDSYLVSHGLSLR